MHGPGPAEGVVQMLLLSTGMRRRMEGEAIASASDDDVVDAGVGDGIGIGRVVVFHYYLLSLFCQCV